MAEAYSEFADVYDELMDATPYEEWKERIVRLIREYGVSKPVRGKMADAAVLPEEGAGDADRNAISGEIPAGSQLGTLEGISSGAEWGSVTEETPDETERATLEEALATERDLVVDLGCGTGTLTELLYKEGYDVVGVDNSEAMLAKAMEKKEESGSEILYLMQDMRELSLYSTVGTVVSACDSINYVLEEEELLEVFSLVNNYLYPKGIFIFDFNTDYKYREVIGDSVIAENREDCSFIWENYYDPEGRINEYDLTMFLRREGELFERVTETHLQRGYEPSEIRTLLEKAGLSIVLMRDADDDGEVRAESERVYVVARETEKKAMLP